MLRNVSAALIAVFALAGCVPGPAAPSDTAATAQPVPGGYIAQDAGSSDMQAIATKAVELLRQRQNEPSLALVTLHSVQSQVVAGLNYRLVMDVQTPAGVKPVTVVLYRDLQGNDALSSVEGL